MQVVIINSSRPVVLLIRVEVCGYICTCWLSNSMALTPPPLVAFTPKTTIPQIFKDFEIFPIYVHLRPLEESGIYAIMEHAQCIT